MPQSPTDAAGPAYLTVTVFFAAVTDEIGPSCEPTTRFACIWLMTDTRSLALNSVPSLHLMPSRTLNVSSVPSSLISQLSRYVLDSEPLWFWSISVSYTVRFARSHGLVVSHGNGDAGASM